MGRFKEMRVLLSKTAADSMEYLKIHTNRNDDEIVNEALLSYLRELHRQELLGQLQNGYENMASINLQMAEMDLENELNLLERYESGLALGRD